MEARQGNLKVNFREIARDLGISVMTLYRVVNNEPSVRRETRVRVVDALNRHGYYTHKTLKNIKVLFDFTDHDYLSHYGNVLMSNISRLNYTCYATDYRRRPREFFDLAAECDVAVFVSIPENEVIEQVRALNRDLFTITISTQSCADVTISPNNTLGGELAARHFYRHGHRHVAVHLSENHPTRMERYKAFFAELKLLDPACRIDCIEQRWEDQTTDVLADYFRRTDRMPDAIFFLAGGFAEIYLREFLRKDPARFGDLSVMTFDNPEDQWYAHFHYDFDRIEFVSPELLDWAEYYITNRPMMRRRAPIHTSTGVRLVVTGSVKDLRKEGVAGT